MTDRLLNCALVACGAVAFFVWLVLLLLVLSSGGAAYTPKERTVPIVYDKQAYTLVIEESTGRSWREYADGHIEIVTEGYYG